MEMFELKIIAQPALISGNLVEIKFYFTVNHNKTFEIIEIIPDEQCKDKELLNRMIDGQFYEMKKQIKKYFSIKS
jgi:hypothetical protein